MLHETAVAILILRLGKATRGATCVIIRPLPDKIKETLELHRTVQKTDDFPQAFHLEMSIPSQRPTRRIRLGRPQRRGGNDLHLRLHRHVQSLPESMRKDFLVRERKAPILGRMQWMNDPHKTSITAQVALRHDMPQRRQRHQFSKGQAQLRRLIHLLPSIPLPWTKIIVLPRLQRRHFDHVSFRSRSRHRLRLLLILLIFQNDLNNPQN